MRILNKIPARGFTYVIVFTLAFSAVATIFTSKAAYADTLGTITPVATSTYAYRGLVEGSDGRLWYGGDWGIISATTKSGVKTNYTVAGGNNYHVDDVVRGPDGNIWYTYHNSVQRITPSGTITSYTLPTAGMNVTGWIVSHLAVGPDGNIWVGSYGDLIGQSQTAYRLHVFSINGDYLKNYPSTGNFYGIDTNYADGTIWYARRNNTTPASYSLVKINPGSDAQTTYSVPSAAGNIGDLVYGNDGKMWLTYNNAGYVGGFLRVTAGGTFTETAPFTYGIYSIVPGLDGNAWMSSAENATVKRVTPTGSVTNYSTVSPGVMAAGSDGNIWFTQSGSKVSKIGTGVSGSTVDADGDGVNAGDELAQGTSDFAADTDQDGLSDYLESTNNPSRDSLFCNSAATTCEYPSPTQKDIYIEADWMDKPGAGGYSMQPTNTQINTIKSSLASKGIRLHVDNGQLDGGNEVPYNSDIAFDSSDLLTDFYDYKDGGNGIDPQFNQDRYHIYHYMLFGYIHDSSLTSGVSKAGDDDSFISYGLLKDNMSSTLFNAAISSIVTHELGHTLCLTNPASGVPAYTGQPASCRFSGIDTNAGISYPSAENYDYALNLTNYSTGTNGAGDHDDWSTIRLADFATSDAGDPTPALRRSTTNRTDSATIEGIPLSALPTNARKH